MSKERMINTSFWDDQYIITLDPVEKLLFLYFLTNPLTNIAGIYEVSVKRIAFDTGIDHDTILKILERFEKSGKIFHRHGYIIMKNFIKHQNINGNFNVKKGIDRVLQALPVEVRETLEGIYKPLEGSGITLPILNLTKLNLTLTKPNGEDEENFVTFFNNNIHPITPFELQKLSEYESMGDEVIKEAMKEAVKAGVRKLSYIEAILRDWQTKGIKDIAGVEAARRDKDKSKEQPEIDPGRERAKRILEEYDATDI